MAKRTLAQILSGKSTVVNRNAPKTKPSMKPRPIKGAARKLKGNNFGIGWGG